jgi:heme-degrading monooxygenase HmoA
MKMSELYTSIIWFKVKDGMNAEFVSAFHDAGMVTRSTALEGCHDITLFEAADGTNQYFVIGHWDSREWYDEWQRRAVPEAPREAMKRMSNAIEENRSGVLVKEVVR